MPTDHRVLRRPLALLLASSLSAAAALSAKAADPSGALNEPLAGANSGNAAQIPATATTTLIKRLVKRGVLSKEDGQDLLLVAEADAAEANAQLALAKAALAQAAAAEARTRALSVRSRFRTKDLAALAENPPASSADSDENDAEEGEAAPPQPAPRLHQSRSAKRAQIAETEPLDDTALDETHPPANKKKTIEPPAAADDSAGMDDEADLPPPSPHKKSRKVEPVPDPAETDETDATPTPAKTRTLARSEAATTGNAATGEAPADDDEVRVTYVPEVVKEQLRAEVKQDVMDQARQENWASPRLLPDWILRFRLFGDFRLRYDGEYYPTGNDNTGAFPNFNAINTGTPFDTVGSLFSPQLDVDQNRERFRLRARLGASVDLGENFTTGLRIATGENDSPVTENQSLGLPINGQGGNFSKYPIWLDRAFLKYEVGGQPDEDFSLTLGRFDNPFFATSVLWADDLGFDGAVVQSKFSLGEDVTPFFTAGTFPVYNTDLNFGTNQPAKFKSNDKWLYGAQLGATFDVSKNFSAKVGVAYYLFENIEGKLSTPFVPLTTSDSGDTDDSRPAFAQKGNTYMALRDITASPLNNNGAIDQFQYYGLASKFRELAFTSRFDFNALDPFQVSLTAEYVRNLAFDEPAIVAKAVNNLDVPTAAGAAVFAGGDAAWIVNLKLGDSTLEKRWNWNVLLGYRKVDSDAVVDGFTDADFGGGGTNMKGFTLAGNLALASNVWLNLRWFSAVQVAGPQYKNDTIQFDVNAKF